VLQRHFAVERSRRVSDATDNRFGDIAARPLGRFFSLVAKARHSSTVEQSSRVEVSLLPQQLKTASCNSLQNYPQVTAFESRGGAAPVCAKSTRRISRVMWWTRGGVSDEWT
jgi:hypothetical protein